MGRVFWKGITKQCTTCFDERKPIVSAVLVICATKTFVKPSLTAFHIHPKHGFLGVKQAGSSYEMCNYSKPDHTIDKTQFSSL